MSSASARVIAGLVVALSLVSGIVIGIALDRRVLAPRSPFGRSYPMGPPGRLGDALGLSPAQRAAVDSIVKHCLAQRDSITQRIRPAIRLILDSTRTDIERVLTPEQRDRFARMRSHERSHRFGPSAPDDSARH